MNNLLHIVLDPTSIGEENKTKGLHIVLDPTSIGEENKTKGVETSPSKGKVQRGQYLIEVGLRIILQYCAANALRALL